MKKIPRIHIEGAIFYVTSRGDNNEDIFRDEQDYHVYLELLNKYKDQYGFALLAYCLIPNHLHLLIELKEGLTISDIMHDLNTNYTKYFNGKLGRKGHLFKERSKINIIEKAQYLEQVAAYIHLNPVALGLAKSPEEYKYSDYAPHPNPLPKGEREQNIYPLPNGEREYMDTASPSPILGERMDPTTSPSPPKGERVGVRGDMQALGKQLAKNPILGSQEFIDRVNAVMKSQEEAARKKLSPAQRRLVFAGAAAVLILALGGVYFYKTILSKQFENEMDSYYKGMSKTLQIEKQKVKVLEERMGKGAGRP